jgi:hypothetical protein
MDADSSADWIRFVVNIILSAQGNVKNPNSLRFISTTRERFRCRVCESYRRKSVHHYLNRAPRFGPHQRQLKLTTTALETKR